MPNDSAMNRLLYAILSQKCLKDIDWNAVSSHPALESEKITNGHAARMRYSRFKKQMDTSITGIPPSPPRPRKQRVEKTKPSPRKSKHAHLKHESEAEDSESIKTEDRGSSRTKTPDFFPSIKNEYGSGNSRARTVDVLDRSGSEFQTPGPVTPGFNCGIGGRSISPTPSSSAGIHSFAHSNPAASMEELDMMGSFVSEDIYGAYGMSTGLSQGMGSMGVAGGLFGELQSSWGGAEGEVVETGLGGADGPGDGMGRVGVCVKREERWDDGYGQPGPHSHHHHPHSHHHHHQV